MYTHLSVRAKDVQMFVLHVSAHLHGSSAQRDFNNQVERVINSVDSKDSCQHLSSVTLTLPNGLMYKVAKWKIQRL